MINFFTKLHELLEAQVPCVSVTVVDVTGSVPQDPGAKMLVTEKGLFYGTVGGGKIEVRAIEAAQRLLQPGNSVHKTQFVHWNLNKDIGMTCGGSIKLFFESFNVNTWKIVVFGAGHIAQALIPILINLDCQITCLDSREEWLQKLPDSPKLIRKHNSALPSEVKHLSDLAFVLLMTMGHTTDKPILLEILKSKSVPYLGVIGSDAKARQLKQDVLEAGFPAEFQKKFYCPIGLSIGSNHPQEIAISIAAQLLQERDRLFRTDPKH